MTARCGHSDGERAPLSTPIAECALDDEKHDDDPGDDARRDDDFCLGRKIIALDLGHIRIGHNGCLRRLKVCHREVLSPKFTDIPSNLRLILELDLDACLA